MKILPEQSLMNSTMPTLGLRRVVLSHSTDSYLLRAVHCDCNSYLGNLFNHFCVHYYGYLALYVLIFSCTAQHFCNYYYYDSLLHCDWFERVPHSNVFGTSCLQWEAILCTRMHRELEYLATHSAHIHAIKSNQPANCEVRLLYVDHKSGQIIAINCKFHPYNHGASSYSTCDCQASRVSTSTNCWNQRQLSCKFN